MDSHLLAVSGVSSCLQRSWDESSASRLAAELHGALRTATTRNYLLKPTEKRGNWFENHPTHQYSTRTRTRSKTYRPCGCGIAYWCDRTPSAHTRSETAIGCEGSRISYGYVLSALLRLTCTVLEGHSNPSQPVKLREQAPDELPRTTARDPVKPRAQAPSCPSTSRRRPC